MRQLIRFLFQPATFIHQLQWSTNHTLILMAFCGVALVESQVGTGRALNNQLSWLLAAQAGIPRDLSLILVLSGRVFFLLLGALSLAETLWWLGMALGQTTSRRVLYRRLSVVLTLLLGSYTLFALVEPWAQWGALATFSWGLLLGYLTLREQFRLTQWNSAILGLAIAVMILFSWQVSDRMVQSFAGFSIANQMAHRPARHFENPR